MDDFSTNPDKRFDLSFKRLSGAKIPIVIHIENHSEENKYRWRFFVDNQWSDISSIQRKQKLRDYASRIDHETGISIIAVSKAGGLWRFSVCEETSSHLLAIDIYKEQDGKLVLEPWQERETAKHSAGDVGNYKQEYAIITGRQNGKEQRHL